MSKPGAASPRWPPTLILAAATALLAICAARLMFGIFMFYDDEGYVLLSYRNFVEQGGLYREVFSQYGPFPFVFHWLLQLSGYPLTHAGGRILALGIWVLAALMLAVLAGRATRSTTAALSTLAGAFACLYVMTSEPSHPGGLIVALVVGGGAGGWFLLQRGHTTAWGVLVGVMTAALALTKVNVGVFAAFAAAAWLALHLAPGGGRRLAVSGLLIACPILPLGLMRDLLSETWVATLALVWSTSAASVVLVLARAETRGTGGRSMLAGMLAGLATAAFVLAVPLARGSGTEDLLEGIVRAPLRNAVRYSHPFGWWPGIGWASVASFVTAAVAVCAPVRLRNSVNTAVASLRIAVAVAVAFALVRQPVFLFAPTLYGFILPCLWLFTYRLETVSSGRNAANAWLTLLLLGQSLHAYPVAGSQVAWACVLAVPLAAIGSGEALEWLSRGHGPRFLAEKRQVLVMILGFTASAATCGGAWNLAADAIRRDKGVLVGLPGSGPLRQSAENASLLRIMTLNAVTHADVLFSEPGMFSFNLWSGVRPPTGNNVTHWFSLLDEGRQKGIIEQLAAHPRAVVIADRGHSAFLTERGFGPRGPLHDFIAREFRPAFRTDSHQFLVKKGRTIRPFLIAELLTRSAANDDATPRHLVRIPLLLPSGQPIASVEILGRRPIRLDATNSRLETTPLSPLGDPTGPAASANWPAHVTGPVLLSIYFDSPDPAGIRPEATLVLRGPEGNEVGLARFGP